MFRPPSFNHPSNNSPNIRRTLKPGLGQSFSWVETRLLLPRWPACSSHLPLRLFEVQEAFTNHTILLFLFPGIFGVGT